MHTAGMQFDLTGRCALCIFPAMSDPISIRQLRKARGWTQDEMAAYFGVDKATVWRWENRGVPIRGPARQAIERAIESLISDSKTEQQEAEPSAPDAAA